MKKMNNKGYMLVEIILAFVIAMGIIYFMFELIIKLKNKNDDLLVKTLVATDQAIIYNTIMRDLYGGNSFSCDKIQIENNKFKYNGKFVSEVSEYAEISYNNCLINDDEINILILIKVEQLGDDFNVNIKFNSSINSDDGSGTLPLIPVLPSSSSSSPLSPLLPTVPSSSSSIFTS